MGFVQYCAIQDTPIICIDELHLQVCPVQKVYKREPVIVVIAPREVLWWVGSDGGAAFNVACCTRND